MSLLKSLLVCVCLLLAGTTGDQGDHVGASAGRGPQQGALEAGASSQGVTNKAQQIEYQDTLQANNEPESTTDDPESTSDDPESTSDDPDYFYDDVGAYDEDKDSTSSNEYDAADTDTDSEAPPDSTDEDTDTSDDADCQYSDDEPEDAAPSPNSAKAEGQA